MSWKDLGENLRPQMPPRTEPTQDDGSGFDRQTCVEVRALLRRALGEVRESLEREGCLLYGGWWRTREKIRGLRWQARKDDLVWLADIVLVLLVSGGIVALAYQILLFFLFP